MYSEVRNIKCSIWTSTLSLFPRSSPSLVILSAHTDTLTCHMLTSLSLIQQHTLPSSSSLRHHVNQYWYTPQKCQQSWTYRTDWAHCSRCRSLSGSQKYLLNSLHQCTWDQSRGYEDRDCHKYSAASRVWSKWSQRTNFKTLSHSNIWG